MTSRSTGLVIALSDSFGESVRAMATEQGFQLRDWRPDEAPSPSGDDLVRLILAGGAETEALDLLPRLPPCSGPTFVVGAAADHRIAIGAIGRGARDYFALPTDLDLLRRTLERVARDSKAVGEAERFTAAELKANGFDAIIGTSASLLQVVGNARRVAEHRDVTVLLGGETGTGKELLARAIHYHSPRSKQPFIEINCGAIPANLLESELFGHERGAFTGAVAAKPGLFELADGGTIFLDEVANLPLDLQPKLLRALEAREIRRVGGQQTRKIDVRIVAASHADLSQSVARGEFREDLFYRLNVVSLLLPPLRGRNADVELLAEAFVARLAVSYGLPIPELTPEVRTALRAHPWPGNVRELRNSIERALVLSPRGTLAIDDLLVPQPNRDPALGLPFPAPLGTIIRAAVLSMLRAAEGNKSEAARRLGISRPRLQRILDGDTE
ncbi:MAG: sigma 54-interacting transcriptional regulator [Gemmatimonadota bacterium]